MTPREEAERIAREIEGDSCTCPDCLEPVTAAIESALRAAESRGEQRGRVQGLRDAAEEIGARLYNERGDNIASWLRERADALDQQPPAETPTA